MEKSDYTSQTMGSLMASTSITYYSSLKSRVSCCSAAARFCWALLMRRGRRRSGWSSLMPMMGWENCEVSSLQVMKYFAFFITTPIFFRS